MNKGLFYNLVMKDALKYQKIKHGGAKEKSISFGVGSIINSVFVIIFAILIFFALELTYGDNVVGGILLLIISGPGVIVSFLNALIKSVYQLSLNKKPIGYVSLGIVLTMIVGIAIAFIVLSN